MASTTVQVKARLGDELRKLTLNSSSFADLWQKLRSTFFDQESDTTFRVSYSDADGDEVTISSDEELADALSQLSEQSPILRVTVARSEPKSRTSSPIVVGSSGVEIASITTEDDDDSTFETIEVTDATVETAPTTAASEADIQVVAQETATRVEEATAEALPQAVPEGAAEPVTEQPTAAPQEEATPAQPEWLQHVLSSDLAHVLQTRDVAIGLYSALPLLLSRVLDNNRKLVKAIVSSQFLEQHLPVLVSELILKAPTLAATLARPELDAVLVAHAPAAAEALRALLAANEQSWKATADALADVRVYRVNTVALLYRVAALLPATTGTALLRLFVAGADRAAASDSDNEDEPAEAHSAEENEHNKTAEQQPRRTVLRRVWDWLNGQWRVEEVEVPAPAAQPAAQTASRCCGGQQSRCRAYQSQRCGTARPCGADAQCQGNSCDDNCDDVDDSEEDEEEEQVPRFVWRTVYQRPAVVRRPVFAYRHAVPWGFRNLFAF
eukprot:TRINITY_DN5892_c0_g1_i1.p1 TRINITY_DN5892_c0_g1~~TRINITY_DN5892_c0_g1_i1.p1  ORF type:complete len:499 (-),score=132.18 TRINITY_DN5892_c0_g1_i1:73-1569(-)